MELILFLVTALGPSMHKKVVGHLVNRHLVLRHPGLGHPEGGTKRLQSVRVLDALRNHFFRLLIVFRCHRNVWFFNVEIGEGLHDVLRAFYNVPRELQDLILVPRKLLDLICYGTIGLTSGGF